MQTQPEHTKIVTKGTVKYGDWIQHEDTGRWWKVAYEHSPSLVEHAEGTSVSNYEKVVRARMI